MKAAFLMKYWAWKVKGKGRYHGNPWIYIKTRMDRPHSPETN